MDPHRGFLNTVKFNFYKKIKSFLREVFVEIKKTTWLNRKEIFNYTIIVLVVAFLVAMILGLFDFAFFNILNKIIVR